MKREENNVMRDKILDAVISCKIKANGDEVSLSQVAYNAGISERTLNRYFPDKEFLFYDAAIKFLRERFDSFANRYFEEVDPKLPALDRLLFLVTLQTAIYKKDVSSAKIFTRAFTTALRTAIYNDLPLTYYDAATKNILMTCVEEGIKDGSIRSDAVPLEIYLMVSSCYLGLVQRLIYTYSVDMPEEKKKEEILCVFDQYAETLRVYLKS